MELPREMSMTELAWAELTVPKESARKEAYPQPKSSLEFTVSEIEFIFAGDLPVIVIIKGIYVPHTQENG